MLAVRLGFNEAAGIHRRKPLARWSGITSTLPRFNEAAGIHRRKLYAVERAYREMGEASMRPPEFTGGNPRQGLVRP